MPRETIADPAGSHSVAVGWSAEQGVQLGVQEPDGRSLFWLMLGSTPEHQAELGAAIRVAIGENERHGGNDAALGADVLNAMDTLCGVTFDSLWSDLDRHRCNRLILLLRKARNAAFGEDA